jgi:hypothetical protein
LGADYVAIWQFFCLDGEADAVAATPDLLRQARMNWRCRWSQSAADAQNGAQLLEAGANAGGNFGGICRTGY